MRIKLGDYGTRVAPTVPGGQRVNPRDAFVDPDAGLGDAAMRGAAQLLNQDRAETRQAEREAEAERKAEERQRAAEAKAAAREADRVKSLVARANINNGMGDLHDQLANGVRDGTVPKEDVFKRWDETSQKYIDEAMKGVAPEHQELVKAEVLGARGRLRNTLGDVVTRRNQQEIGAGLIEFREAKQREALRDRPKAISEFERAMDAMGPKAGMDPTAITKAKQEFRERVTFTDIDRRITAAQTNGKALSTLARELAGPEYADLAPERRNFLESKIQQKQQHLAHMGEVSERRRMTNLGIQERRLSWYVENGRDIPQAEFDAFVKAARGTPYDGAAQMIIAEQKAVADLQRLSPAEQVAKVKELEKTYGPTPSKEQITHLEKVRRFTERSVKLLNDSPLDYAVARDGAKVEPLNITDPASWAGNLANRTAVLTEQAKRTGVAPKGLFPQEVAALTQMMREAPVAQRSQILTALRQGFGDDRIYRATMQQIAPDDPVTAVAGVAAGRGLESARDRALADVILRGQQALRPNKKEDGSPGKGGLLPMPKDDLLLREFESYARDAFAGHEQARNAYLQTARAIYAAKAVEAGDFTGNLDSSRWREAMQLATGGIEKVNGKRVVLPWGHTKAQFEDGLDARVKRVVDAGVLADGMSAATLRSLPLEVAADGKYVFRAGDGIVVGKDRRPIVIDFNEPLPYVPSGERR